MAYEKIDNSEKIQIFTGLLRSTYSPLLRELSRGEELNISYSSSYFSELIALGNRSQVYLDIEQKLDIVNAAEIGTFFFLASIIILSLIIAFYGLHKEPVPAGIIALGTAAFCSFFVSAEHYLYMEKSGKRKFLQDELSDQYAQIVKTLKELEIHVPSNSDIGIVRIVNRETAGVRALLKLVNREKINFLDEVDFGDVQ